MRLVSDRKPYFVRKLRCEALKLQRRKKTDNAARYASRRFDQRAVLAKLRSRRYVEAASDTADAALTL